jgi:hypothetical protein
LIPGFALSDHGFVDGLAVGRSTTVLVWIIPDTRFRTEIQARSGVGANLQSVS